MQHMWHVMLAGSPYPGPCIFYALSIPIELSSRGQTDYASNHLCWTTWKEVCLLKKKKAKSHF